MSTFTYHGYFEDLFDLEKKKGIGQRFLAALPPGREVAIAGAVEMEIGQSFQVSRGHKTAIIKIKPGAPRRYRSTIYPICGRMTEKKL